jgi:hypothetical protein
MLGIRGARRRTGRKCKLTDQVAKTILNAIAGGATYKTACIVAGIGKSIFYNWLDKAEEQEAGLLRDFLDALRQVEA